MVTDPTAGIPNPSRFLTWDELACRDTARTPYPGRWRTSRLPELVAAFEDIRLRYGFPIKVDSAYRTPEYNASIGGAPASQHVEGRALDLAPLQGSPGGLKSLLAACRASRDAGLFRGLGTYSSFVHVDVRPGRNATWSGSRSAN